jgi:hypothetical protein
MWSLQISKDLLEYIQSRSLSSYTNINAFDFSTLYITIPHSTLQDLLKELVQEKIEDTYGLFRSCKLEDMQYSGQRKQDKWYTKHYT